MDAGLAVAGVLSLLLGIGHETLGVVWVLPKLSNDRVDPTPFGPSGMTAAMISASWHLITVFVFGMATFLIVLAWVPEADPKTVGLRAFGTAWVTAALVATSVAVRRAPRFRDLFRLPIPVLFVVVGVLCWTASL